ncbi:DUF3185 family protein [Cellvibrio polysaccharolyticus]|uniref:DUF3185 family protein n=1 Tax=Cellvibrio polysaccharolyticus TaxID=2082724 RepID=A0A928YTR1_9GAMM|nr:DUF3185 family protein [Cellvibrio polysaccharolyticus]MBE8717821.1 DUF3185 family protein [Cellvibrio polysaccharolyticus]
MSPVRIIGIALIVLGVGLAFMGYQESQSVVSEVSEAVTGTGTDRSMTLIIGGIVSLVVGLVLTFKK